MPHGVTAPPKATQKPTTPSQTAKARPMAFKSIAAHASQQKVAGATSIPDLSDDERTLRGLLQFFVCSDVQRQMNETPLSVKYHDFVHMAHEVLQKKADPPVLPLVRAAVPVKSTANVSGKPVKELPPAKATSLQMSPRSIATSLHKEQPVPCTLPLQSGDKKPLQQEAEISESRKRSVPTEGDGNFARAEVMRRKAEQGSARAEALRRKAEQVLDAQMTMDRLWARREALAAQMEEVRLAKEAKTGERRRFAEQLRLLLDEEERLRERLRCKVRLRMDTWSASYGELSGTQLPAPEPIS